MIIGCPKSYWDDRRKRCRVGTIPQALLVPKTFAARRNPSSDRGLEEAVRAWKKFQHGGEPKKVTRMVIGSGPITSRIYAFHVGTMPEISYRSPAHSGRKHKLWVHRWKSEPDIYVTSDKKLLLVKLKKGNKVTDFFHG